MMDKNSVKALKALVSEIHDLENEVNEGYEEVALEAFLRGVKFVTEYIENEDEGA